MVDREGSSSERCLKWGDGGGVMHRQKNLNEILPGVDLQILLLIEQVVWCFASEFGYRVFCSSLILVMGSFFKD